MGPFRSGSRRDHTAKCLGPCQPDLSFGVPSAMDFNLGPLPRGGKPESTERKRNATPLENAETGG